MPYEVTRIPWVNFWNVATLKCCIGLFEYCGMVNITSFGISDIQKKFEEQMCLKWWPEINLSSKRKVMLQSWIAFCSTNAFLSNDEITVKGYCHVKNCKCGLLMLYVISFRVLWPIALRYYIHDTNSIEIFIYLHLNWNNIIAKKCTLVTAAVQTYAKYCTDLMARN